MDVRHLAPGVPSALQNRKHALISCDLTDKDLLQPAQADRREVDPPIPVDMATWSAGRLDYWVKERQRWLGIGSEAQTAVNDGPSC